VFLVARFRLRRRLPWILKYGLRIHRPRYRLTVPDLGLEKEENRLIIFWTLIFVLAILFGGIFMVTYEFTPPLIEVGGGRPTTIYPGFSRETFAEFILAVVLFISAAVGGYMIRTAPRREEEAWESYMYGGLVFLLVAVMVMAGVFAYKAGLLRFR